MNQNDEIDAKLGNAFIKWFFLLFIAFISTFWSAPFLMGWHIWTPEKIRTYLGFLFFINFFYFFGFLLKMFINRALNRESYKGILGWGSGFIFLMTMLYLNLYSFFGVIIFLLVLINLYKNQNKIS
jgi:hypothetical protein